MTLKTKRNIVLMMMLFMSMILIPLLAVSGSAKGDTKYTFSSLNLEQNSTPQKLRSDIEANKKFRVLDEATGKIMDVDDREFMYGAVVCEMPPTFETEALKSQAVATYTYFSRERKNFRNNPKNKDKPEITVNTDKWKYYVTEDKMRQRWGENFDKHYNKIKEAVDSVFGEVVEDNGELILAAYHAMSSGQTERCSDVFGGDLKYLVSVPSPGDKLVPNYKTTVEVSKEDFQKTICGEYKDCDFSSDPNSWISDVRRTPAGMVKNIKVGSHDFKGSDIRKLFSLRSADFDVSYQENKFVFTVRGYGHGVGMSQYGAEYMAQQGADYKQILLWYYPNTTIETI